MFEALALQLDYNSVKTSTATSFVKIQTSEDDTGRLLYTGTYPASSIHQKNDLMIISDDILNIKAISFQQGRHLTSAEEASLESALYKSTKLIARGRLVK
jgi:hypothetical protein